MVVWQETISRALARVAMDAFPTAADALFELVDNPIDHHGRKQLCVAVQVDRQRDSIVIEDLGGAGMDANGIADWLNWGSGRAHRANDISVYRQGGKAACGYLANSLLLWAKRAGSKEVWVIEDQDWRDRNEPKVWGVPSPIPTTVPLPASLAHCSVDQGFVRLELSGIRANRLNLDDLRWRLSSTYRRLIEKGVIKIVLNEEPVGALALPLSSAFKPLQIDEKTSSGYRLRGWVGRLDRDAVIGVSAKRRMPGGIRCLYQGRLVREGEYFGHRGEGKGVLASLIGEVELSFVRPIPQKTDFHRDSAEWQEVERRMHDILAPVVAEFRKAADRQLVTREERKNLNKVCDELADALRTLQCAASVHKDEITGDGSGEARNFGLAPGGRKTASPSDDPRSFSREGGPGGAKEPRTSPPPGAVGRLVRLMQRVNRGDLKPPVVLDALDPHTRSSWRTDGGVSTIVVNTNFCLYKDLEARSGYLAETIVMELAKPVEGESRTLDD